MKKFLLLAALIVSIAATALAQYPVADDTVNPPTGAQRAFLMCFDGTTWDRCRGSSDGVLFFRTGGPTTWSCSLDAIGATLTQCQAAPGAGLKLYLTDLVIGSTTATAGQYLVRYGTAANCGTGTTSLFPAAATVVRYAYPGTATQPTPIQFFTPLSAAANNAICILCVATNTCTVQMSGYTAP